MGTRSGSAEPPGFPGDKVDVAEGPGRSERDAELMRRIRVEQDRTAFEELARYYAPRLKGWLTKRGESGPTAEDLVQDVLITAWHKADRFDPAKAGFATWLFRLTRNRWIDYLRKHRRMVPVAPEHMTALADRPVDDAHDELERAEAADAVHQEMAHLPAEQKKMLHLAFFEGLSHREIAELTGLPLGTVKSRIRVPLKRLQDRLRDFEGGAA